MPRMKTIITLLLTAFLMHAADQLVDDHIMKVTNAGHGCVHPQGAG